MNHLKIKKDFVQRGYRTPDDYFKRFSQKLVFPEEKSKVSFWDGEYVYAVAGVLILLFGIGFFIQHQHPPSPSPSMVSLEMSYEEEYLVYDSGFDFEDNLLSMLEESDLESSLFDDLDADVIESYLDDFAYYDEY